MPGFPSGSSNRHEFSSRSARCPRSLPFASNRQGRVLVSPAGSFEWNSIPKTVDTLRRSIRTAQSDRPAQIFRHVLWPRWRLLISGPLVSAKVAGPSAASNPDLEENSCDLRTGWKTRIVFVFLEPSRHDCPKLAADFRKLARCVLGRGNGVNPVAVRLADERLPKCLTTTLPCWAVTETHADSANRRRDCRLPGGFLAPTHPSQRHQGE